MTLFIVMHVTICVFLVCVILLQPGKSDGGIGFGSSSQSIFGSKGAGNFLTKTTSVAAILFLCTSFVLTRSRIKEYTSSVIKANASGVPAKAPAPGTPGAEKTKDAKAPAEPVVETPKAGEPAKPAVPQKEAGKKTP